MVLGIVASSLVALVIVAAAAGAALLGVSGSDSNSCCDREASGFMIESTAKVQQKFNFARHMIQFDFILRGFGALDACALCRSTWAHVVEFARVKRRRAAHSRITVESSAWSKRMQTHNCNITFHLQSIDQTDLFESFGFTYSVSSLYLVVG